MRRRILGHLAEEFKSVQNLLRGRTTAELRQIAFDDRGEALGGDHASRQRASHGSGTQDGLALPSLRSPTFRLELRSLMLKRGAKRGYLADGIFPTTMKILIVAHGETLRLRPAPYASDRR